MLRVLLVEDNFLGAMSLKVMLESMGCVALGPFNSPERAEQEGISYDLALLDINIVGGTSFEAAIAMLDRGCPVIFVTGYSDPGILPPELSGTPIVRKPIDQQVLADTICEICGDAALNTPAMES